MRRATGIFRGFGPTRPAPSAREEAVRWALLGEEASMPPELRLAFRAWLDGDPLRPAAYARAAAALDLVEAHAAEPEILALRQRALSARRDPSRAALLRPAAAFAALLAVTAAVGGYGAYLAGRPSRAVSAAEDGATSASVEHQLYRTAVGERATVSLPDGSVATLDTDSALQVDYTPAERGVRLLKGQALFEVAKHRPTPFQAYAGDRRITAVGTLFDVRLDRRRIKVALIEGRIRVAQLDPAAGRPAAGAAMLLGPGEVLETGPGAPMRVRRGDVGRVDSWKDGVLVFDDARLADAVNELNRYTVRPIVIRDAALRSLRVTGVFKTGQPERFAQTMAEIFPLAVTYDEAGAPILIARRSY